MTSHKTFDPSKKLNTQFEEGMHMYRQQVLKPRHKHHFPKVGAHNSTRMQEMQSEVYVWTWPEHEDITWHIAGVQGQRMSLSPPHPTPPPHPQKTETQKKRASCHGRKGVVVQLHTPDKSHHFWNLKKLAVFLNKARKNHHPEFPKPPWIFGEFFFSGWSGVTSIATWCTCSPNCCFFNCSSAPQAKAPTDRTHNMQASASCFWGETNEFLNGLGSWCYF